MRACSLNHPSTRVPGACIAWTRSNCNPRVAKTLPAPSHRPAGGAGAAPTSSTLSDAAAGRCSTGCNQAQTPPSVCVARRPHETPLPHPAAARAGGNPFLEPRARHRVHPWLSTRARPVTQSLNAVLFIAVMPFVSRRSAQPSQPRGFLMLHPLQHVRDHRISLVDTPALAAPKAPQLGLPRFVAKEVCRHHSSPKHGTLVFQLYLI